MFAMFAKDMPNTGSRCVLSGSLQKYPKLV